MDTDSKLFIRLKTMAIKGIKKAFLDPEIDEQRSDTTNYLKYVLQGKNFIYPEDIKVPENNK